MKFFLSMMTSCLLWATVWAAGPVNVNTASAEELSENLKGIGISKAQLIVEYRDANGPFLHADELVKVKGIGLRTVDMNRDLILIESADVTSNN